ncbi:hypothetical protein CcaverHIS002_0301740 [Cutaneotrichosporon cavernicola]|uniref:Uncharacterized protein n=1 Tax=Cutaneotrichosporon cavernicola TaxID=279322 RepID=A0AA48L2R0_9TREE|nr:uncharacterized protein CcaverHIS019_0301680 [Cutaneotrichosporon cavernicola]BEI82306.1 hypothetical protein CcaverHIS002_0301740 [Cutaneotrichosporon cavernicola]BEI90098.1 hypothetical protein CcaverHIS019_0301680 [Cutaneotrichosporon cavernicola]BEI97876.1 hypothetical protein CcaverHIS631_0301750 [Cutaneotrichosporon cavernicola]BEJ05654.1 hypothetical protein CcaverHIS641_0301760 [Cutaneotrichosporon cavernicola]
MSDTKARGPVEELISKRLRPLNKKIQRFKGYTTKPEAELNDDQRAGLASLPQLEAAVKELEDLSRAVEDAELVAAAKIREEREAADRAFDARVAAATASFQLAVAERLASFLCLHTLLRPARPDDHENLTFAPLALPLRLQDEVRATDILRVARMYDDLTTGGDAGHGVLVSLSVGPNENDEEDERVHHLLHLLSQEEEEEESVPLDEQSNVPEAPQSVADTLGTSEDSEFDPQRTPVVNTASLGQLDEPVTRGVALNFLQEDELAPEPHDFEVEVETPISNVVSSRQSVTMDWADHDDDDSAARFAAAMGTDPEAEEEDEAEVTVQVIVETQEAEVKPDADAEPAAVPEAEQVAVSADGERRKRKPRPRKKEDGAGGVGKGKPVDDEGFEVKTARRASTQRGRGRGRGRGGAREGGRQGEREPREGGERRKTENKEGKENEQRRGPRKDNAPKDKPKETKPKPSIYKAVQPGAPVSVPIL